MDMHTLGTLIRNGRTASGLSQKALAAAAHISRVTLSNLEAGRLGDIGALKLAQITDTIGLPMFARNNAPDFVQQVLAHINTSYRQPMDVAALQTLLLTGQLPNGFEGQVLHLLDETPTPLLAGLVRQLAHQHTTPPKRLWKNLAQAARQIHSPNPFWNSLG